MPDHLQLSAVANASLRKRVEDILRNAITCGELKPGKHLVDRELCNALNVSRTVIREAQRSLEAEGLVVMHPNRGCFVRSISLDEVTQLYEVRAALEPLAARAFAQRASAEEIARLLAIFDEFRLASKAPRPDDLGKIKNRFYAVLLEGSRNAFVEKMMNQVLNHVSIYRNTSMSEPGRLKHTVQEMRQIVDAIAKRDADAAWSACLEHVNEAARSTMRVLEGAQSAVQATSAR